MENKKLTGYPSIDKPWLKYYTDEAINAPLPDGTIYEYLWQNNKDHLDDIALNYYDRTMTYRELFFEIDRAANAYAACGVETGDIVTFAVLACPETVISLYALNKIGAIPNMVNVLSSADEFAHYINEAKSRLFVCWDVFYQTATEKLSETTAEIVIVVEPKNYLPPMKKLLYSLKKKSVVKYSDEVINWNVFMADGQSTQAKQVPFVANTACVMAHTGGTTGEPKGVLLSNEAINAIVVQEKYACDYDRQETYMDLVVPFVIYGIATNIHMPLVLGFKLVMIPFFKPEEVPKFIMHYKPNLSFSIPAYWASLLTNKKAQKADFSYLRLAGAGGDGLSVELEQSLNSFLNSHGSAAKILNGYGMTEVAAAAADSVRAIKSGTVGIPYVKNVFKAVKPDSTEELPYNEVGEICIHSPSLMLGYYNNEQATNELVKVHADGKKWVHTGDLGYIDEDGFITITGRIRRIILTSYTEIPSKIFPDRIEKVLMQHSAVFQCCVVSEPHPQYKAVTRAHIVLKPEYKGQEDILEKEINDLCHKNLPDYSCPFSYCFRQSLPLTAVGKVDWRKLEEESK